MGDVRVLESIVELPGGLFLSALTLLIGSCIVGSIVAASERSALEALLLVRGSEGGLRFRG